MDAALSSGDQYQDNASRVGSERSSRGELIASQLLRLDHIDKHSG